MKNFTQILLISVLATLAGCATGPAFSSYSKTVPPPKSGESRIWFYRPSKMIGFAIQPQVNINNVSVGKAQPGCFFYSDKPEGEYEIKCTTEWSDKLQLTVKQNSVYYVKLTILPGLLVGHIKPSLVPENKALKDIKGCNLITADGRSK